MSQKEACALLDVNPPTAKLLTDRGYLTIVDDKSALNRQKLDRASVEAFADRWIAGKHYAEVLGCQDAKVALRLREMGIDDLATTLKPGGRNKKYSCLYERETLRAALRVDRDPDDQLMKRIWKRVARALGANKSSFMLWSAGSGRTAMFATADRLWTIHVTYDLEDHPIRFRLGEGLDYGIDATLRISGAEGVARTHGLKAVAESRRLPHCVRWSADLDAGVFEATMSARLLDERFDGLDPVDYVANHGDHDAVVIERMLYTLRACFQEGERTFERLNLGLWPHVFLRPETNQIPPQPIRSDRIATVSHGGS